MSNLFLSVIVPTYNYGHSLFAAVASVANQSGDDFEIIVIDDGSQDSTANVIKQLVSQWPVKVRAFSQSNQGVAVARNFGSQVSKGEYLLYLDSDDEMLPNTLSVLREAAKSSPHQDFFLGKYLSVDESGVSRIRKPGFISENSDENFINYINKRLIISHGSFMIKAAITKKVKYPEGLRSGEDISFFGHLFLLGKISEINEPLVKIFKHDDSLRHNIKTGNNAGLTLVDELFNPEVVPARLMRHKKKYSAQRCLSLSRSNYISGDYRLAKEWYLRGIAQKPAVVFKLSYLKNFIRSLLSSSD